MAENERERIERRWRRTVIAGCATLVLGLAATYVIGWYFGKALARAILEVLAF